MKIVSLKIHILNILEQGKLKNVVMNTLSDQIRGGGTGGAGGAIAPPTFAILLSKQPLAPPTFLV